MGPPVSAAFDAEGHPTNAGLGFARKLGVDFDALERSDTPKREVPLLPAAHSRPRDRGRAARRARRRCCATCTFPKADALGRAARGRKGRRSSFGRPIRWLLFLYGGRVVPFTIARQALASSPRVQDVTSGAVTYGHRFLATSGRAGRAIKVRSFDEYRKRLAENFVDAVAHRAARSHRARPRSAGAADRRPCAAAAAPAGRGAARGSAGPRRVSRRRRRRVQRRSSSTLPDEVLTTTLIHHQHFFPVLSATGALMPAFLAVTNTQTDNDRAHRDERRARRHRAAARRAVLLGRRSQGRPRGAARRGSTTVLFHKQLGLLPREGGAHRAARAAGWRLTSSGGRTTRRPPARAARLAKADLATDMVREFTELQGTMGGIYAREAGEPEAVWKAIYHHYLPIGVESTAPPVAGGARRGARRRGRPSRSPTSSTRSSGCSWRASGRPGRAIRSACDDRRTACCASCSTLRRSPGCACARSLGDLLTHARRRGVRRRRRPARIPTRPGRTCAEFLRGAAAVRARDARRAIGANVRAVVAGARWRSAACRSPTSANLRALPDFAESE